MTNDPFSMSTMLNSLQHLRFAAATQEYPSTIPPPPPRGIPIAVAPPSPRDDMEMRLQWMFNLMTNSQEEEEKGVAPFKEMISKLDPRELQRMASLLTSDSDYFLEIARNKKGSSRLQKLLGRSDDVDTLFSAAILRLFLHVMTDKHASYVAIHGVRVFDEEKRESLYEHTLHHALHLARDQHGCVALNEIITDLDHPFYRNQLLDVVAHNALWLSNDPYGNFVVQNVLKLHDLRCTHNIAVNLRGHYVKLSFKKYGSYIVERLLETAEESMVMVVEELLECEEDRLMRLARSEYGNFVVAKALRVTQVDLFWGLVQKLMPFLHFFSRSRGSNIAAILLESDSQSVCLACLKLVNEV